MRTQPGKNASLEIIKIETRSHYTALVGLELYVDQVGLKVTEIYLLLPSEC